MHLYGDCNNNNMLLSLLPTKLILPWRSKFKFLSFLWLLYDLHHQANDFNISKCVGFYTVILNTIKSPFAALWLQFLPWFRGKILLQDVAAFLTVQNLESFSSSFLPTFPRLLLHIPLKPADQARVTGLFLRFQRVLPF